MDRRVVISVTELSIGYPRSRQRERTCLYQSLSFDLYAGELVCLLGANGAGKSTLLRTMTGLQKPLNGDILLNNKNLKTYKEKDLSKILGLVLTDKTLVGGLTVRELVELGRYPHTGFFGLLNKEDKIAVEKAMTDVCIIHKSDNYVAELSDGEKQKAMIAKSLAQECPIILLDEPTAYLDIESRIEIVTLLSYLAKNQNKTILLSTHDIDLALLLADRLLLLSREEGLQHGATEDLVLSSKMDSFFKNKNIIFDKNVGSFLPNRSSEKKVYVYAEGHLAYWAKNIISRYGYEVTENMSHALFTLTIWSANQIVIKNSGTDIHKELSNFEELANWLKNYSS